MPTRRMDSQVRNCAARACGAPRNDDGEDAASHSRDSISPGFCKFIVPLREEGAGKAGRRQHPQPRVRKNKGHERSHYRYSRNIPAFPARRFYGFLRALPGERPLLPPSLHGPYQQLDARVAASGPHDFAVRSWRFRPAGMNPPDATASFASHRTVRDDREPPLWRVGRADC